MSWDDFALRCGQAVDLPDRETCEHIGDEHEQGMFGYEACAIEGCPCDEFVAVPDDEDDAA